MATTMVNVVTRREGLRTRNGRRYNTRSSTTLTHATKKGDNRLTLACIENCNKTTEANLKVPVRAITKKAIAAVPHPTNQRKSSESTNTATVTKQQAIGAKAEGVLPRGKHERRRTVTRRSGETAASKTTISSKPATKPVVPDVPDVDCHDTDPQQCQEYVKDIYRFLRVNERESCYRVEPSFLEHTDEVTDWHRAILIDWLVLVVKKFHLLQETLYLAVDIMDRYLQVSWQAINHTHTCSL